MEDPLTPREPAVAGAPPAAAIAPPGERVRWQPGDVVKGIVYYGLLALGIFFPTLGAAYMLLFR